VTIDQIVDVLELFSRLKIDALQWLASGHSGLDEDRLLEIEELQQAARSEVERHKTEPNALTKSLIKAAMAVDDEALRIVITPCSTRILYVISYPADHICLGGIKWSPATKQCPDY